MVLRLNSSFYQRDAIEEAIRDFNAGIEIMSPAFEISVPDDLAPEFANYVLGLMKNKGLI